ncbi:MAG: acyl-CoA dehydrogenase family protein, partial [Pseudoclavibacter sp.]
VARGMEAIAERDGDHWTIRGRKRWIGNASVSDFLLVIARDAADGEARAFLVPRTAPGVEIADIGGKISLRMVRNGDIELNDVRVPESSRLPGITRFADVARILGDLRFVVAWNAAGMQAGAYEAALRHATEREQFGRPIGGFQLVQEQLARMLGNVTATLALAVRITELRIRGRFTGEIASLAKAFAAARVRETVALGRGIGGGDGLLVRNDLGRYFADAEAVYTYEGTHEMNSLIVGRAASGLSAFTSRP